MVRILACMLLFSGPAFAQDLTPPGDDVRDAVAVQVTQRGLDQLELIAQTLIPELLGADDLFAIDDIEVAGLISLSNLQPNITVGAVDLRPANGELIIETTIFVGINSSSAPARLDYLLCDNDMYVDPFPIAIDITIQIQIVRGANGNSFDVMVDLGTINSDLAGGDIHFPGGGFGCSLTGGFVSIISDALVSFLQPEIETAIRELEPQLEAALDGARFDDTLALLDTEIDISIEPSRISITPEGILLILTSSAYANVAECVVDVDPGGSLKTLSAVPDIGGLPTGTQVAAQVSDELINQISYAAYRGGMLCFTLDESAGLDLPIALDSSLLELLGGEGYAALFEESGPKPLVIKTKPNQPPVVVYDSSQDVNLEVRDLQVGMFVEVEHRMARALGLSVDMDAGVNVIFDSNTGELSVDLALTGDDLQLTVVPDVLVAGTEQDIQEGITGLVDTLLGSLLGGLFDGPLLTLPAFEGVGLTNLTFSSSGDGDWLTGYAAVGVVTYADPAAGGCDSTDPEAGCGGCESSCDAGSGCSTSNFGALWLGLMPMWFLRRRRR